MCMLVTVERSSEVEKSLYFSKFCQHSSSFPEEFPEEFLKNFLEKLEEKQV